jgi:hypothetical protein
MRWTRLDIKHSPNSDAFRTVLRLGACGPFEKIGGKSIALQEITLQNGDIMVRTVALRKAKLARFTADEIALVDDLTDRSGTIGTDPRQIQKL